MLGKVQAAPNLPSFFLVGDEIEKQKEIYHLIVCGVLCHTVERINRYKDSTEVHSCSIQNSRHILVLSICNRGGEVKWTEGRLCCHTPVRSFLSGKCFTTQQASHTLRPSSFYWAHFTPFFFVFSFFLLLASYPKNARGFLWTRRQ